MGRTCSKNESYDKRNVQFSYNRKRPMRLGRPGIITFQMFLNSVRTALMFLRVWISGRLL
jgi:hypothetical protein